jgi:endonuclease G
MATIDFPIHVMDRITGILQYRRASFLLAVFAVVALICGNVGHAQSPDMLMGNPSNATADASNADNFLMVKPYFALSYNNAKGTPNWVSWRLTDADIGSAPRVPFYPDEDLPSGFRMVTPADYTGSGFDRGHMCDHSDRSATPEASHATFVMTNMIPQSPYVNEEAWAQLEAYCRNLVEREHKHLYIISGPAGQGGEGKKGPKTQIGKRTPVIVPAQCWKVIMVLDGGPGDDLQKVNANTRLIVVIMPNDMTVGEEWAGYRVSVRAVEQLTGYTFFDRVPMAIIERLKAGVDSERIPHPVAMRH